METFIQLTVHGLSNGAILALAALGFVLIYKATGVINFAQGEFLLIGAYVLWAAIVHSGLPWLVAIGLAMLVAIVLGLLVERLVLRPLVGRAGDLGDHGHDRARRAAGRGRLAGLGRRTERLPGLHPLRQRRASSAPTVAAEPTVGDRPRRRRARCVRRSSSSAPDGIAMRAVADDQQAALAMGISVRRVVRAGLGDLPASRLSIAGMLVANLAGVSLDLKNFGLLVFPVVILGGLDSVPGAIVGGAVIGLLQQYSGFYLDPRLAELQITGTAELVPYVVLVADPPHQALRPLRSNPNRAGVTMSATSTGVYHRSYRADLALRATRIEYFRLALLAAAVVAAPYLVSAYWLHVLNDIVIAVIGAIGLNILVGFTGQISLGQAGFLAVGAYTAGLISIQLVAAAACRNRSGGTRQRGGWRVLRTASAAAQGALPGDRDARLTGDHHLGVIHWQFLGAGEPLVITEPTSFFGWVPVTDKQWYWVIAVCATLAAIVATNLFRTGVGRAFVAIRDQDIAAEAIGVDTARYKVIAFALSSGFAGVAGALTAYWTTIVTWERFTIDVSMLYLAMIIIGGLGSVSGSVYGAIFIVAVPAWLTQLGNDFSGVISPQNLPAIQLIIFGLSIALFLVFEPKGLARIWQRSKDYFRLWPFRY